MIETPSDDADDASRATRADRATTAVTSASKILGELPDHDGTVVFGASSGTGITSSGPDEVRFRLEEDAPVGEPGSTASAGPRVRARVTRRRRGVV